MDVRRSLRLLIRRINCGHSRRKEKKASMIVCLALIDVHHFFMFGGKSPHADSTNPFHLITCSSMISVIWTAVVRVTFPRCNDPDIVGGLAR